MEIKKLHADVKAKCQVVTKAVVMDMKVIRGKDTGRAAEVLWNILNARKIILATTSLLCKYYTLAN